MTYPVFTSIGDELFVCGVFLAGVHSPDACAGRACVIHNPTEHHMRHWPLLWRDDRGLFERLCAHGVGHPDPDQREYWRQTGRDTMDVHGCDGCCGTSAA